jgi:DNA-directed RNA polymerase specialized sigma24 family protein
MDMNEWINRNYQDLYNTTKNVVKHQADADDLFQSVMEQLLQNKQIREVPHERRKYFFIRTLKNNYYSKT